MAARNDKPKTFWQLSVRKLIQNDIHKGKERKEKKLNEKYKTACASRGALCPSVVILAIRVWIKN